MQDLDKIYEDYGDGVFDSLYFNFNIDLIKGNISQKPVLELSTSIQSTVQLSKIASIVEVVDGSKKKLDELKRVLDSLNIKNVKLNHSNFFDFHPEDSFDEIILFRTLEHIEDRVLLLQKIKSFSSNGGFLTIAVPNALSLHRRLGIQTGYLTDAYTLNDDDFRKGHVINFDKDSLETCVQNSGWSVEWTKGSFLKLVPDSEMQTSTFYDDKKLDAIFEVSKEVPSDFCAELVLRCKNIDAKSI